MKLLDVKKNNGGGIAVIIYGITLILVFTFIAINIANAKVIQNGYSSLRDAVQAASSGAVMHLLTTERNETASEQKEVLSNSGKNGNAAYDIYLQLALGYVINRMPETSENQSSMIVQSGEINNFIKLDHQKVINSTLALLNDSIIKKSDIHDVNKYKILMIFIEPHYGNNDYKKYFNVIVYGNEKGVETGNTYLVGGDTLSQAYNNLELEIENIVNASDPISGTNSGKYKISKNFKITLDGTGDKENLIRRMETMPYYMIVVKDFALPTLFDGVDTRIDNNNADGGNKGIFKSPFSKTLKRGFTEISGDGHLTTPMCALNSGKTERKLEGLKR